MEHSKREMFCMIFDVPEFVFTITSYDVKTCIVFIIKNLRENGFYVKYYYPKILFVSWDIRHIHNKHVIEDAVLDMDKELSNLTLHDTLKPAPLALPAPAPAYTTEPREKQSSSDLAFETQQFPFKNAVHAAKPSGKYVIHLD
jgi:hypothetical protein